jgi:hypothetical protein
MKVMVDAGVSCIRGSQKPFAVAGSSRSSFKESALKMRIPSTVPTKSESSMDGDRERHGLFRARPLQAAGSACPSPASSYRSHPMFYGAACEVHQTLLTYLPTDG